MVPRITLLSIASENCDYTNNSAYNKNCYLIFAAENNEECYYGKLVQRCKDSVDTAYVYDCQFCYETVDCNDCYQCFWSDQCANSTDLLFCFNCRGSSNCMLSWNLQNKQYCIENQQYPKDEYERRKQELCATYASITQAKEQYRALRSQAIVKYASQIKCENSTGNYLYNARDSRLCFDARDLLSCAYLGDALDLKDCQDGNNVYQRVEICHDFMGVLHLYDCQFVSYTFDGTRCQYTDLCTNGSEDVFGCVGMRKVSYCILNKQYTKDEYLTLREKIITSMKADGSYGEFFPARISPFGYNETVAQEYFPLTKNEVASKGWKWEDQAVGKFGGETVQATVLPERIKEVQDTILQATIACGACGRNYKIIKQELGWYRKNRIPLPHKCFECRHQDRMASRNPRQLWHRQCACTVPGHSSHVSDPRCPNEFETSYAPERSEKVYCEPCYQSEVL